MSSSETVVGAYGSGRTAGKFEPLNYIKKPEVILRLFGWLFSIVVFGCIADKGRYSMASYTSICVYNGIENACHFGIAVGVVSFLGLMAFLVTDALFDNLSNIQNRKYIVIADVFFSCAWGFMWLVCFSLLTDMWRKSRNVYNYGPTIINTAQAAIGFSFFCLVVFISLAILAIIRLRQGIVHDSAETVPPPPPYCETTEPPPAGATSLYSVGDPQFSPHPFGSGPGAKSTHSEPPAY